MKLCTKCLCKKPVLAFHKNKQTKDGLTVHCRECNNKRLKAWKQTNKEHVATYDKAWQQANKDKKAKNYKNYQVNNRAKVNSYNSYRRALEVQATPKWLTASHKLHMECKYSLAMMLSRHTAEQHHVDHIVPLNGKTVCGLHVPWNLQVITAKANLSKSNRI